jgi:hypothetical protein
MRYFSGLRILSGLRNSLESSANMGRALGRRPEIKKAAELLPR